MEETSRHPKLILIVEDDTAIRESLQMALEMEGYGVETAANGREALDKLTSIKAPALILLDLMMPVMNGWEFLTAQRADPRVADIPVVIVSAIGEKMNSVAASGYIRKPIELNSLLQLVQKFC